MKKITIILLLAFVAGTSFTAPKPNELTIMASSYRMKDDGTTPELDESQFCQIEFKSECASCGKIYLRMDGKFAGIIDTKFRNVTSLVKKPGTYLWTAKDENGQIANGEVIAP
ncbi:MAG: hypothetical protein EXR21_06020 [Flavobacteriaceae bacterium]|nr:hypothetical protein [Flavobacteriaceae bacterium]